MSIAEVEAALREVLDIGERTRASIHAVITRLRAARERIARVTVGSTHPLIRRILTQHTQAIDKAEQALADLDASEQAITDYLITILGHTASTSEPHGPWRNHP